MHLQRKVVMHEIDFSAGDVILDHRAQRRLKKTTAGRALIVTENFHGDRSTVIADGLYGRGGSGIGSSMLMGRCRGFGGGGRGGGLRFRYGGENREDREGGAGHRRAGNRVANDRANDSRTQICLLSL